TVPDGFKPIEILHQAQYLQPLTPLSIAGYGRTASQCENEDPLCHGGKLLFVDTLVREFVNKGRLFNLIVIGPRKDHGPCFGDSGGPAYVQKDGRWFLSGNFMGWDRILVPEQMETICDTGEAIYNFVGDFVTWIERSSLVKLNYDRNLNPRNPSKRLDILSDEPADFQGWCNNNNHESPAWFTMQRLIRMASDFRIKSGEPEGARELFENCQVAEEWLRKMIKEEPSLTIPGFDPSNFIDSARLEDIRPLKVLADMGLMELTLTDHSITDLSPLAALTSLKKLTVIDNVVPNTQDLASVPALRLAALNQLSSLHLQNSGAPLDFQGLTQTLSLQSLSLSYLEANTLQGLGSLALHDLRIDSVSSQEAVDLSKLDQLETLYLSKVKVTALPVHMNRLKSLELLEVLELNSLPREAQALTRLFLYASDMEAELELGFWPELQDLSIVHNLQLKSIRGLSKLPKLRLLEIADNHLDSVEGMRDLPELRSIAMVQNGLKVVPELSQL
ncbi:MAG: hypothetical protein NTX25_01160, partial [Proteobacteria bacterium]|nr:hypothetical protein [Pseudomonadota bacterium]